MTNQLQTSHTVQANSLLRVHTAACMYRRAIGNGPLSEAMMLQNVSVQTLTYTNSFIHPNQQSSPLNY